MKRKGGKWTGGIEWVGGRVLTPFYVTQGEPFRAEMFLWIELPDFLIVQGEMIDPEGPPFTLADALVKAMESPLVGPPRRPSRIRVADKQSASEVAGAAQGIEVVVAPTPELDEVVGQMADSFKEGDRGTVEASYFEEGRVSPESVEELFRAAAALFQVAPWKVAADTQVLRLDIPQLGVEGACISIIGTLGESVGLIIFPSFVGYQRFLEASASFDGSKKKIDLGTSFLSLNFERGADLPAGMRREAARHGWPVAGPDAYPWVQKRDRDGQLAPLTDKDVRIVSACTTSLAAFFLKHRRLFESDTFEPVCESWFDRNGLEVRFTVPYEADILFEVNTPRRAGERMGTGRGKVGRNDPCPCGSGKKHKKCCLGKEESSPVEGTGALPVSALDDEAAALHRLDQVLVEEMLAFTTRRFGNALARAARVFDDPEATLDLFVPWAVYHFPIEGKPIVQWFLEERGSGLSGRARAWLKSQQASWLSIWEVTAVDPRAGRISLEDLLTGEERTVREVRAAKDLVNRDVVLARIVDHGGISLLCGVYPRALPPMAAAEVIRRVRGRLRRKRAVPVERIRDEKIGGYMIRRWEEAVEEMDRVRSVLPRFQNTEGEDLLFTTDYFEFEPEARRAVETCLESIEGIEPSGSEGEERRYTLVQPGNSQHRGLANTVIGTLRLFDGKLRVETNSVRRADRLRAQIEKACGEQVRHRMREHSDPAGLLKHGGASSPGAEQPGLIPPEEAARLVREFKEKHYADWVDQPLPALDGMTPAEAVRSKEGKRRVDVLLKEMENHEYRMPEEERFDFSGIRRTLGLDP